MAYVDGFLLPVPKKNLAAYLKLAKKAGKIWMEHGALAYMECVSDQLEIPGMKMTFPKLMKLKPDEVVVFSWIQYESRATRDRVNKKVMSDPRLAGMSMDSMPFDMKRMSMGGFKPRVSL